MTTTISVSTTIINNNNNKYYCQILLFYFIILLFFIIYQICTLSGDIYTKNLHFIRILALILIFQISAFGNIHTIKLPPSEKTWHGLLGCFSA